MSQDIRFRYLDHLCVCNQLRLTWAAIENNMSKWLYAQNDGKSGTLKIFVSKVKFQDYLHMKYVKPCSKRIILTKTQLDTANKI